MNNKVYVAARFDQKLEVVEVYDRLRSAGFVISRDWTRHACIPFKIETGKKVYRSNPDLARIYSIEDIQGVIDADYFILLANIPNGQGKFIELGAAISLKKICYVFLPKGRKDCLFYYHPSVEIYDNIESMIQNMRTKHEGSRSKTNS